MKLWLLVGLLGACSLHWTTAITFKRGNLLLNIDGGILKNVTSTTDSIDIDLSGLQIRYVAVDAFDNLMNVRNLNLSNNNLRAPPDLIENSQFNDLEELSLANNQLIYLSGTFVHLRNLKLLDVSNNSLKSMAEGELSGLPTSADIIIEKNPIMWISSRTFENPSRAKRDATVKTKRFTYWPLELYSKNRVSTYPIPNNFRAKICMSDDGLVKSVSELQLNEELSGCKEARIIRRSRTLDLGDLGIKKFQHGWYNLSVDFMSRIDLSYNLIADITPELLNDLPPSLSVVRLDHNSIQVIKGNVIANSYCGALNLEYNNISTIEDGAFEKTNLTSLSAAHNRLTNLSFVGTSPASLRALDLSYNAIPEIPVDIFRGFKELRLINLVRNSVTRIEPGTFLDQENLSMLRLSNNQISELNSGIFKGLKKLAAIDLTGNRIKQISRNTFSERANSTKFSIYLHNNEIDTIEEGSFSDLNINHLELSNNKITDESLAEGAFNKSTLSQLSLGRNFITKINGELFNGILGEWGLDLTQNKIRKIEKGAAKYMKNLDTLNLSKNPLELLENGALYGLSKVREVYVRLFQTPIKLIQGGVFDDM